ncbi:OmpA family protein [Aquimarina pacifica]|uniref:OmpA family protein n=1 Tax=Aquimarina pacifica TaxID=1296415 RepID=UPI0004AF60AE|nr:OmpA family protein [Aquimarina pacifica]
MKKNLILFTQIFAIKKYLFFYFAVIFSSPILSQDQSKIIAKADQVFKEFAYIDARAIYLDVAQQGYTSKNLFSKLADSYYFTADMENSVEWYEKLIQNYPEDLDPEYLFRYAQSLKSVERYQESDQIMNQFYEFTKGDKRATQFIEKRNYLDFIDMQSGKFDLYSLSINSENSEYAPSFNGKNQIIFASSREKNVSDTKLHGWTKMPFLDFYSSNISEDQLNLDEPVKLKGPINSKFHESSATFSEDGTTVYFSRNNYNNNRIGKNKEGIILLKLYQATFKNDRWGDIVELPFSSNNYSVSHPALSADGSKLYFASDMPGTIGQSDLFVVDILGNGKFSSPRNLGASINTEGRETFPYISKDGTLYFASDGHVGLGGLDIFIAKPDETGFSNAFNVGRPINSPKDDFTFVINDDTGVGFFASNRKGGKGNDDLYSFKQTEELITSCLQYIEGSVKNSRTNEILIGASITLLDDSRNVIDRMISDDNGLYKFTIDCETNYILRTELDNFLPRDIDLTSDDTFEFTHTVHIPLKLDETTLLSTTVEINIGDDLSKTLQLEPIYFGIDDAVISSDDEVELQKIISVLKKYPEMKIDVCSHTDSRSSHWYNKKLSVERMRATIRYLVRQGGIDWRRLHGKAYGERRPINNCTDDTPCTEEQHQENRRSEFIITRIGTD